MRSPLPPDPIRAPTRVLVVGARGVPDVEGGAEKNAEMLFPRLVARGYDVTLMGLSAFIKGDRFRGVRLLKAPTVRFWKTDKVLYYLSALAAAERVRPDIVHFQGLGSAILLWAHRLRGRRTVVRYGSADYLVPKWGRLGRLGFRASEAQLRWANAVIAVTPALARRLAERGIERNVVVIPNAIDETQAPAVSPTAPSPSAAPYALFVGRVTAQKNVRALLQGFRRLKTRRPDARLRLRIVGGLEDAAYVESLSPELGPDVDLVGHRPRSALPDEYRGARIFINASMHEGHSNAVLEAISHGCPILLSDIVENRDFGLPDAHHFDSADADSIAEALERADADPDGFRVPLDRFLRWDEVAARTAAVYEAVRAGRPLDGVRSAP